MYMRVQNEVPKICFKKYAPLFFIIYKKSIVYFSNRFSIIQINPMPKFVCISI